MVQEESQREWIKGNARHITFIVTENCQLRCKYCYITGKNSIKKMSFDIAAKSVDMILDMPQLVFGNEGVVWEFIGGEPLMEIDLIDRICDYIKIRMFEMNHPWFNSYRISISTNGLLYSSPKVQKFIEKNSKHLSIGISIDGNKEKHDSQRIFPNGEGSYEEVLRNVKLWLAQFPEATTKATISHDDLPYVKDSVLHLWSIGIKYVNMNTIFENCWEDGDDLIFERQLTELADEIIANKYYNNFYCSLFDRSLSEPVIKDGNDSNWCGAGKTQSSMECMDCEDSNGCAWCQGANYDFADSDTIFQRATYICKMHKARVRANKYFWNKLDRIENGK